MSAFHEAIKQILREVDKFLNSTLSDENLSKSVQKERCKIVDALQKLFEEYEVLNPHLDEGSSNSSKGVSDESRFTIGSTHSHGSEEDGSSVDNIPYTTVKALVGPVKLGYLTKKPTDLLEKFSKQKKYVVIHKNVLYWFKKPTDKKHQGAIILTGYECVDITVSDKEFVFELKSGKKKCYQFQADSRDDLDEWMKAVVTGCTFVEQSASVVVEEEEEIIDDGETYEPIEEVVQAVRSQQAASSSNPKPLPALPPNASGGFAPQPESPTGDEEYADGFSMAAQTPVDDNSKNVSSASTTNNSTTTTTTTTPAVDEFDDDDLVYEFVESTPDHLTSPTSPDTPPPRPPPISQQATSAQEPPPLPSRGAPLPPLPPIPSASSPPLNQSAANITNRPVPPICPNMDIDIGEDTPLDEDFANMFYGVFTCVADSDVELSFDRGDVVHVLNRDLDLQDWWIGESYGKVGLVPKQFLTPMYEMVA